MFACNYILHADYHGVSGFSVSYVPIKIKTSHIVILHYHVETLSELGVRKLNPMGLELVAADSPGELEYCGQEGK